MAEKYEMNKQAKKSVMFDKSFIILITKQSFEAISFDENVELFCILLCFCIERYDDFD